jgi:putative ABC transport system permease protein
VVEAIFERIFMITNFEVAYKNLLRKRIRSLLTIVGIALSSWVLVSLLGFNQGYEAALNKDIDNMGFSLMIMAKGCPYEAATMMLKGGTGLKYMQESILEDLAKEPEVEKTTPILMSAVFDPNKGESGGIAGYFGVEPKSYSDMKTFLTFRQGAWFTDERAFEVVMGYEAAELEQREVGDMILMPEKNVQFKVVGILNRTGTQDDGTIFAPLKTLQTIFNRPHEITTIGIKVKKGANSSGLEERLYKLPDVQIVSLQQVKDTIMKLISTAKVMVLSIAIIAILIAMVGVVNTILTSVWERMQEIGILKTIGAMPWDIFKLIWTETLILCTTGGILGVVFALILARVTDVLVRSVLPYAPGGGLVLIDAKLILITLAAILCIGLLSGIYPAWRAGRIRPLEAIRSEVNG